MGRGFLSSPSRRFESQPDRIAVAFGQLHRLKRTAEPRATAAAIELVSHGGNQRFHAARNRLVPAAVLEQVGDHGERVEQRRRARVHRHADARLEKGQLLGSQNER